MDTENPYKRTHTNTHNTLHKQINTKPNTKKSFFKFSKIGGGMVKAIVAVTIILTLNFEIFFLKSGEIFVSIFIFQQDCATVN